MKRTTLALVGSALLLLVASCGPSPRPAPTPTPLPTPAEIAQRAGRKMLATDTLHFTIDLTGSPTYLDTTKMMIFRHAEGDLVRPDQVRTIARLFSFGLTSEIGIIELGKEQYVTNPLNQKWEKMPPDMGWYIDPTLFFDPQHGIEAVLQATVWAFNTDKDLEDPSDYVLHGQVPGEQLWALTFGMITAGNVTVDFWVDHEEAYVRRIQLVELDSDPQDPTTWLIELSAFNKPVDIQAPPTP